MAITISGENNNDKILASDGVIDQISGFSIVGVVTATSFTGDLIGNVTGNLTGNVNSTSPLLLQTGGSERFRITGNNELGIAGANYGSAGQVLTSGGSGSAVSWTTPATQTSIVNYADNKLVTATGSGTSLNAEANLTFDGAKLTVTSASKDLLYLNSTHSEGPQISIQTSGTTFSYIGSAASLFSTGSSTDLGFRAESGKHFLFGIGSSEKVRITSDGHVLVGTTDTSIYNNGDSASEGIVLRNGEVIDIARKGDLQLTLNRQTNDGPHIAFYRSGAAKHFISTFDNDLVFEIGGSSSSYRKHRFNSTGDILLGAHGSRIFDDSSGTNIVVDIYGGATAGKRGILALGGRSGSNNADIGTIQFVNENNNLATSANHVQSKLVASIDVKSETSDSNAGSDSGGSLILSTKAEAGALAERLRITSDGKIGIGHHIPTQITKELTIRPADGGGILMGRPGDTVAPINVALQITTRTSGSEAYHTEYHTANCNAIFATYEGGGTGGNLIFQTGVGSGNDVERLRIQPNGGLKLSNTAGGHLIEYGGSSVNTVAAIDINRNGNGYADIRLASNYGASLRLAGAGNNTDEYNITQDNQKNAYHNLEYDGFINFVTNNNTQACRMGSGKVSIAKNIETLTGNGFAAALQVNNKTTDGYGTIMMGGGYNRATIGIGNVYDLILTSNAYPANASTGGIKFRCGNSGGGGPTQRFRIHQDGMLDTKQHGTAKTYWFSSGQSGGYSSLTITIDAHAYHSFVITVAHAGYAGSWTTSKFLGYENGSMYYANEGTETTDSNSRNATHSQNPGGGHIHRIQITGGMGTHPVCELRITIGGPDAYIDTGDVAFTWS